MNIDNKSHSDYPVTNTQWKIIDYSLSGYLDSLKLEGRGYKLHKHRFMGISQSYLRFRYKSAKNVMNEDALVRMDPWHRVFKCFPPDNRNNNLYEYYCFRNNDIKIDVNVIVTTVNKQRVHCVDIVKDV